MREFIVAITVINLCAWWIQVITAIGLVRLFRSNVVVLMPRETSPGADS